jgi:RNA polymerase primary sigma factor
MTPYSNSRIMRRCGQLGIPYAEVMGSPFFAQQGVVAPELFVQYMEGVEGYTGSPDRRRPLDSSKTLPYALDALQALLCNNPGHVPVRSFGGHGTGIANEGAPDERRSSASSESNPFPDILASTSVSPSFNLSAGGEIDLTGIVPTAGEVPSFMAVTPPGERKEESYVPPELPRERWRLTDRWEDGESLEWWVSNSELVIEGDGWLPPPEDKSKKTNDGFKEPGKSGRKSKRRARSIRGSWVSISPVALLAWCDELVERNQLSEGDIDELIAECDGDTHAEDLRLNIKRALEAFGFEEENSPKVVTSLWDPPIDVDPDELFSALDATLNRSVTLPGTQRLTMERAADEAELQALLAARQELAREVLAYAPALQAAITLRTSGHRECASELQTLATWTDSGRPVHGKGWRAAASSIEMLWLSEAEYQHVVNESVSRGHHGPDTLYLIQAFERYTLLLTKTRIKYLPYVRRLVSRSLASREEMEDAFQAATLGLLRALDLLNGKSAAAFRFYASRWINQKFLEWRAHHSGPVRLPLNRLNEIRDFTRALLRTRTNTRRKHNRHLLADRLCWSLEKVAEFELFLRTSMPLTDLRDEGAWGASPVADYTKKELREVIDAAMGRYDERDARVMRLYYGLDNAGELTLEEIGSILGVTRERIRQLRDRMIDRLRSSSVKTELAYFADQEYEP